MLELRRIRAGIFKEEDKEYPIVNLYDFEKAFNEYKKGGVDAEKKLRKIIIPGEIVSKLFPILEVKKESLKKLFTGKPIFRDDVKNKIKVLKDKVVCVFSDEMFVGIYKSVDNEYVFAKSMFVYN